MPDPIVTAWLASTRETLASLRDNERAGYVEELISESDGWCDTTPERLALYAAEARALLVPCADCDGRGYATAHADIWRFGGHMTAAVTTPCECFAGEAWARANGY